MRGYGRFVGRVGALAVALGIGSALTGGYGLAYAEDTEPGGGATGHNGAPGADGGGATVDPSGLPGIRDLGVRGERRNGGARAPRESDVREVPSPVRRDAQETLESRRVKLRVPQPHQGNRAEVTLDTSVGTVGEPPRRGRLSQGPGARTQVTAERASGADPTEELSSAHTKTVAGEDISTLRRSTTATPPAVLRAADRVAARQLTRESHAPEIATTTTGDAAAAFSSTATVAGPANVIAGLLSAVGLGTVLAPHPPSAPAQLPTLWAVLAWVRRQFVYTFANKSPQATTQQVTISLVDAGTPVTLTGATDADPEDAVRYVPGTYTSASGATLVVGADGTALYTPSPDAVITGPSAAEITDTFAVTTTDTGGRWHLHGLSGLLNAITFGLLGRNGHTSTHTVTVVATPVETIHTAQVDAIATDGDGTVTGNIGWQAANGQPVVYAPGTFATAGGGTVTVDEDGTFTYTPDVWDRLNAYTHPDENTDTFQVEVTDSAGTKKTITVAVPISPVGVAITSNVTTEALQGSWVGQSAGPDGTVAVVTRSGSGTTEDPYTTSVTVIRPGADPETIPLASGSNDVLGVVVRPDGSVVVADRTGGFGAGATVTLTVVGTGGPTSTEFINDTGQIAHIRMGDDGTVAVTTRIGAGTAADPYRTRITVLRPGEDPLATEIEGYLNDISTGSTAVGDDGTVAITTLTGAGTAADPYQTRITVLRPGEDPVTTEPMDGRPVTLMVGRDGTVAVSTAVGTTDPVTTMTILRPNTAPQTEVYEGLTYIGALIGDDGTVAILRIGASGFAVTVVRPDSTAADTAPIPGDVTSISVGADGTVAYTLLSGAGSDTDPYVATTVIVRSDADPIETEPIATAIGAGVVAGGDGTVVVATGTGTGATEDPFRATIRVLRRDAEAVQTLELTDFSMIFATVGDDDTVVITTLSGTGTPEDPWVTTMTIVTADGTVHTVPVPGQPVFHTLEWPTYTPRYPVVTEDGTIIQAVRDDDGRVSVVFLTVAESPSAAAALAA